MDVSSDISVRVHETGNNKCILVGMILRLSGGEPLLHIPAFIHYVGSMRLPSRLNHEFSQCMKKVSNTSRLRQWLCWSLSSVVYLELSSVIGYSNLESCNQNSMFLTVL